MSKWLNKRPAKSRYIVAYDSVDKDNKIYGIMELDTMGVRTDIAVHFFNDESKIDLDIREINKTEFGTYVAFELFPILTPYAKEYVQPQHDSSSFFYGIDFGTEEATIYKVRFRDY